MATIASVVYTIIKDVGLCLWSFVSSPVDKVCNLEDNLDALKNAMEQLKKLYEDVEQRVKNEEEAQKKCTEEVSGWLEEVLKLEKDVSIILKEGEKQEQNKCLGGFCPINCLSSYKLGANASKKLEEAEKLKTGSQFNAVVQEVHVSVQKIPMDETVGLDLTLQYVWECIQDQNLRIIGLYGTGGVGKTTLLHRINDKFRTDSHDFYKVILVSVSKEPKVDMVQKNIMHQLGLFRDIGNPDSDQINPQKIFRKLDGKKFVLLLDDVWERLNLRDLGIPSLPYYGSESKVIFTTRSEDVCGLMEADRTIKVECLNKEDALRLFRMKVGEDTLNSDPHIPKLAEVMAAECQGLPLALVTVGPAMASRKDPDDWEYGIAALRNTPSEFQGMVSVLVLLKFSFERLQNATLKSCFLYCCLFPEDSNIRKEELIEYWKAEGFLDEQENYRRYGEYIIRSLKRVSLLENGESEEFIKMHSMIRHMAWLECRANVAIFIRRDPTSMEARGLRRWNEVERMSLWDYSIEDVVTDASSP